MKNDQIGNNGQFVISYELLQLLQWLIAQEQEALKSIIINALNNGLHEQIVATQPSDTTHITAKELQKAIIDFFSFLETEMMNAPEDDTIRAAQQLIIPAIEHIDTNFCDEHTLTASISQAAKQLEKPNRTSAKEIFCKTLLKNWNPEQSKKLNN